MPGGEDWCPGDVEELFGHIEAFAVGIVITARSSSLDLIRLGQSFDGFPPVVKGIGVAGVLANLREAVLMLSEGSGQSIEDVARGIALANLRRAEREGPLF